MGEDELPSAQILAQFWDGTSLPVPAGRWRDVITGREFLADGGSFPVAELFGLSRAPC